jgi:hypothetical protein
MDNLQTQKSATKQLGGHLPGKADSDSTSLRASSELQYVLKLCWQN